MRGRLKMAKVEDKTHEIYPEIGECDKDLNVAWDCKKMSGNSIQKPPASFKFNFVCSPGNGRTFSILTG
jgi:hypothetical protein